MKKWGKILSQSDTFDGDYLKKNRMRKSDSSDASLDSNGEKIVAAGSGGRAHRPARGGGLRTVMNSY